jgi:hypothetical protein
MSRSLRTLVGPLAAVVALAGMAGCGAARPSVNTNAVTSCYRALPRAKDAIHEPRATFKGVHEVPADRLERRYPNITLGENDTEVCAFAFQGTFNAGQVEGAAPAESGHFAVVVVSAHQLHLLVSWVGAGLPQRFARGLP